MAVDISLTAIFFRTLAYLISVKIDIFICLILMSIFTKKNHIVQVTRKYVYLE